MYVIESFSIECRKTKVTSQEQRLTLSLANKDSRWKQAEAFEARENEGDQLVILFFFSFTSDWFKGWREFSGPTTNK